MEIVRDAFVDESLQEHLADLLYRVKLKRGEDAFVFVLLEHKSAPDFWVAFQILRYIVRLWEKLHAEGTKQLPPVYPIVLYHGRQPWRVPRNLRALVSINKASLLLQFVPEFEYYLVDLTEWREEDLQGAPYLRAGLLTLKWIFDRALAERLPDIFNAMKAEPQRSLLEHLKTVSKYLSRVKNAIEPAQLKQAVKEVFSEEREKLMADFFQEWIEQGLQQGLQQGRREARLSLTLQQLEKRFGKLPKTTHQRIKKLPVEKMEALGLALLDFQSSKDLRTWLQHNN